VIGLVRNATDQVYSVVKLPEIYKSIKSICLVDVKFCLINLDDNLQFLN